MQTQIRALNIRCQNEIKLTCEMAKGNAAGTCAELNQPHFNIAIIKRATTMAPINKKEKAGHEARRSS
jgi:hypothetical protein